MSIIIRKFTKTSVLALILHVVLLTSCGNPALDSNFSQPQIYGGTKTPDGRWMDAVSITYRRAMYCSGIAVNPRLVLTAAHCVKAFMSADLYVYVGSGIKNGDYDGQYQVDKKNYSPLYGGHGPNDIAYLTLKKPLNLKASDYTPILTNEDEKQELLQVGKLSQLVGFGATSMGFLGLFPKYGEKYEVKAPITELTDNEVYIGGDGKDSCAGDSGGPAYGQLSNGQWRVYGIVSRGGKCGTGGKWGLIHANLCWVEKDSGVDLGYASSGFCSKQ